MLLECGKDELERNGRMKTVEVGGVAFGGGTPVIIAGPCAIEGLNILVSIAKAVKEAGATMLRGGAFKPRTRPSYFQGLGADALPMLEEARQVTGLPVVTEVTEIEMVEKIAGIADMLQIGSRNMYNYPLLREIGRTRKPVLLKRAFSATVEEWIGAAEYIGHDRIVFCERGIRSFDRETRNVLDLASALVVKRMTGLPVIVDPSHATGRRDLVGPMSLAAVAAGVDGLMIETHLTPSASVSDADQTVDVESLSRIVAQARALHLALCD